MKGWMGLWIAKFNTKEDKLNNFQAPQVKVVPNATNDVAGDVGHCLRTLYPFYVCKQTHGGELEFSKYSVGQKISCKNQEFTISVLRL